ncbi:histone-lysine N-methyltransferase, H3 lysine-79 specific-like isoform X2 [Belonocnema kinseyi]|uniref:histone-lysine N-methyltransferase, H3 lysine-79 specific-like isoform X2 n=1 Tax=Belonocnema kinseyi TaxID=2817044 RepID=UPI00143D4981|nr:histone-lysine N-methyltransferase, H3 lysine-79 specific-like isoform X2 [Belonocnema kinseyi]
MATDSDFDSWEFGRKLETTRNFPHKNGLMLPLSSLKESSSFCGVNQSNLNLQSSNNVHENDYDLASKSSRSGPGFRFINPAIYAESFEANENCGDHLEKTTVRGKIHSNLDDHYSEKEMETKSGEVAHVDRLSLLSISNGEDSLSTVDVDGDHAPGTYRCLSSVTSDTTSSLNIYNQQSRSITRMERRCKISGDFQASGESRSSEDLCLMSTRRDERKNVQRCSLNEHRILQGSTTSLSTINLSERQTLSGVPIARQIAHAEWVREKEREALKIKEVKRKLEKKKKEEEERNQRENEERERRERKSFLRWAERKKKEEATKKEAVERELELQKRLKEVEDKAAVAKTIYLRQWARKKEEEHKAHQKKQQIKKEQEEEEKRKRLEDSVKAYEKWREKSKDKPKPATQAHQKAKPAYVNPEPWQQIIGDEIEINESPKEPLKDPNGTKNTPNLANEKITARKTRSSHQ